MNTIIGALRELWGLFVEDLSFTVGILVCLALAIFVLPHVVSVATWRGPVLFALVAAVLIENVYRTARGSR